MQCWIAKAVDLKGAERTIFIRGPRDAEEAETTARRLTRNWKFVGVEKTDRTGPSEGANPVDPAAHEFGVMKHINSQRRR